MATVVAGETKAPTVGVEAATPAEGPAVAWGVPVAGEVIGVIRRRRAAGAAESGAGSGNVGSGIDKAVKTCRSNNNWVDLGKRVE